MTPEGHRRLHQIFEGAIHLSEPERSAYLEQACAGDAALLDRLIQLLLADEEMSEPISAHAALPSWSARNVGDATRVPCRPVLATAQHCGSLSRDAN